MPPGKANYRTLRVETVLLNVNGIHRAIFNDADQRPPCYHAVANDGEISQHLIPAILRLRNITSMISVLIDTGYIQTKITSVRVAGSLDEDAEIPTIRTLFLRLA